MQRAECSYPSPALSWVENIVINLAQLSEAPFSQPALYPCAVTTNHVKKALEQRVWGRVGDVACGYYYQFCWGRAAVRPGLTGRKRSVLVRRTSHRALPPGTCWCFFFGPPGKMQEDMTRGSCKGAFFDKGQTQLFAICPLPSGLYLISTIIFSKLYQSMTYW